MVCCVGTGCDLSPHHDDNVSVGTGRDLSLQNDDTSLQNGDLSSPLSTRIGNHSVKPAIPQMILNEYGTIAEKQWYWLGEQYPYIVLHEFVVMPNHIHGIIEINRSRIISSDPIKIKPLSELIGAYKTTVSKQIHLTGFTEFQWQRSFYEHIIRDEKSFEKISDYIIINPVNWDQDKLYNL
jgi:REP element-mobilizing transposase RayT